MKLELDDILEQDETLQKTTLPHDVMYPSDQGRTDFGDIKALAKSIQEQTQLQNCVVEEQDEKGMYKIIAGARRWRACKLLGITVDVKIIPPSKLNSVKTLIENEDRKNTTIFEKGSQLLITREATGWNNSQIAEKINKSSAWVSRHIKMAESGDEFKTLCQEANITKIDIADDFEKIWKKNPKLARRLSKNFPSRNKLKDYVKKVQSGVNTRIRKEKKSEKLIPLLKVSSEQEETTLFEVLKWDDQGATIRIKETGEEKQVEFDEFKVTGFSHAKV